MSLLDRIAASLRAPLPAQRPANPYGLSAS